MRFGVTPTSNTFTSSETGVFECEGTLFIGDDPWGTQLMSIESSRFGGSGDRIAQGSPSEAMTSDTDFNIEALVENASDSILVSAIEVWVDGI